jgi:hypothetical protein
MFSFAKLFTRKPARTAQRPQGTRPAVEALESRLTPYATTGNAWINPQIVTLSFMPDGTQLSGGAVSNLQATLTARFGSTAAWQNIILKAAQSWAQQTNINFAVVADDGSAEGSGPDQQGALNFGDIRIGGFDFGNTNLAQAYQPPAINNTSLAGDVQFNTAATFSNGTGNDLFTVAAHEFGHALGLDHSTLGTAEMFGIYNGVKSKLTADDIAGAQAVYGGARQQDAYDAAASNNTFATATNLNAAIDPTALTALVRGDVTTTCTPNGTGGYTTVADLDYYTFTAPVGASATGALTVNVQSAGLSLLAAKVTVYAADMTTVLGTATGTGQYGCNLSVTVNGVTDGQQFFVKVQGADTTQMGSGAYAMTLNFGSGPAPTVQTAAREIANGAIPSAGGGMALAVDQLAAGPGGLTGSAPWVHGPRGL